MNKTDGVVKIHIINISGSKFSDLDPGSPLGGDGAIDLVMHVNSYLAPNRINPQKPSQTLISP